MYFKSLMSGKNEEVAAACSRVEKAVTKFRETTSVQTLAVAVGTDKKVDNMPRAVFDEFMKEVNLNNFDPSTFIPRNDALKQVRKFFDPKGGNRVQTEAARFKDILSSFDKISSEMQYKQWVEGREKPFLWVCGPSGCGKSYFSWSMIGKIRQMNRDDSNIIVASAFFSPGNKATNTLLYAFGSIVVQIAEQDSKYNEQVAKELKRLAASDKNERGEKIEKIDKLENLRYPALWKSFILEKFTKTTDGSPRTLYLVLDGLDQLDFTQREALIDSFKQLSGERSAIRVLFTSDKFLKEELRGLNLESIALDELNKPDLGIFIDKRYTKSPVWKRFSEKTRKSAKEI